MIRALLCRLFCRGRAWVYSSKRPGRLTCRHHGGTKALRG